MNNAMKTAALERLIRMLRDERPAMVEAGAAQSADDAVSKAGDDLFAQFRALVNTRPPWPISQQFLALQDQLLRETLAETGIRPLGKIATLPTDERLSLWRGDITTLAVDAIVNAANAQMLGCWIPGHHCIDNAIHTFAGVQLRMECAQLMSIQEGEEPTGAAKTTQAYNLPSRYVIHTVGPIANGDPTPEHCEQLASCYTSCLEAAAELDLGSIAFCCISTGVFGFPKQEAAQIAVDTVRTWLDQADSQMRVVFNVFNEEDEAIYQQVLGISDNAV